jgi:hypothetical protein
MMMIIVGVVMGMIYDDVNTTAFAANRQFS